VELLAFAPVERTIGGTDCGTRLELPMTLASRVPVVPPAPQTGQPATGDAAPSDSGNPIRRTPGPPTGGPPNGAAGRPGPGGRAPGGRPFQQLALLADEGAGGNGEGAEPAEAVQALLPPGFSADIAAESVATFGSNRAAEGMGLGERFEFVQFGEGGMGGFGGGPGGGSFGPGGPGGPGFGQGGPGGGGPVMFMRPGFGRVRNRVRGMATYGASGSVFDAAPFSLNGRTPSKADYFQQRFGGSLGGPLTKLYKSGDKSFFFLNYNANHYGADAGRPHR
jgi:hypothetical protein